jgi:hypothetical protein
LIDAPWPVSLLFAFNFYSILLREEGPKIEKAAFLILL